MEVSWKNKLKKEPIYNYYIDKITKGRGSAPGSSEEKEMIDNVDFDDIAMFILALIIPSFIKRHYKYVSGKRRDL